MIQLEKVLSTAKDWGGYRQVVTREASRSVRPDDQRLKEPGIKLPAPPEPFGTYVIDF